MSRDIYAGTKARNGGVSSQVSILWPVAQTDFLYSRVFLEVTGSRYAKEGGAKTPLPRAPIKNRKIPENVLLKSSREGLQRRFEKPEFAYFRLLLENAMFSKPLKPLSPITPHLK